VFAKVDLGAGVVATGVAAGGRHTCATTSTGGVMCWGANDRGQLGIGTRIAAANPVAVAITNVASLDADEDSTCATLTDGSVKCWGDDTWSQLGQQRFDATSKPVVWG
jgi:alpha-tubulin suppressor-like RCC1 family protein